MPKSIVWVHAVWKARYDIYTLAIAKLILTERSLQPAMNV